MILMDCEVLSTLFKLSTFFKSSLGLSVLIASVIGLLIILIVYLYSKYANDNRYSAWAKIEIYQLGVSLIAFGAMVLLINLICNPSFFSDFVNILFPNGNKLAGKPHLSFMNAANNYLSESANYSYNVFSSAEYFYAAYSVASRYSAYLCGSSFAGVGITKPGKTNKADCIMGGVLGGGGGAGIYVSTLAGYGTYISIVSFISNGALMVFFTNMLSIFILKFSTSGLMLFLFPLGLLIRMIPFSRRIGAALMSIGFAFIFVYPLVLSAFYIDVGSENTILAADHNNVLGEYSSKSINDAAVGFSGWDMVYSKAIGTIKGNTPPLSDLISLTFALAHSFLLSFFIPTLAFIITIGSLNYMLSLLGVELDLSRLLQMV